VQALLTELRRVPPGEPLVQVLTTLGTGHDALGRTEEGLAFHEEALATARLLGARHAEVDATVNLLWSLPDLGRHDEAIAMGETALKLGDYDGTPALLNNLAFLYWDRGRFAQAEPLYQRLSHTEDPTVRCFAWAKCVALAARRGDGAARDAAIESALATLAHTEMYRAHAVVMVAVLSHGNAEQGQRARAWWRPAQALDPSLQQQLDAALTAH
jgi:tetratricopeptide (TPR) repeat protein